LSERRIELSIIGKDDIKLMEVNVCCILRVAMNNTFSKVNSENDGEVRLGEG